MGTELILAYLGVLVVLICLEGLLAADNAVVLAIMVKHLPEKQQKKALFYGLAGALVLRFGSLFIISFLVDVWQVQALGAAYLLIMSGRNLYQRLGKKQDAEVLEEEELMQEARERAQEKEVTRKEFWWTVVKVEFADLAFAVDSILAAVALAITLPPTGLGTIGTLDTGQFIVVFLGGMIGVVIMRFAANIFVGLLKKRPNLEIAAFCIVGWVGVKLLLMVLAHPQIALIPEAFPHSTVWQVIFYSVLVIIALVGWITSGPKKGKTNH